MLHSNIYKLNTVDELHVDENIHVIFGEDWIYGGHRHVFIYTHCHILVKKTCAITVFYIYGHLLG